MKSQVLLAGLAGTLLMASSADAAEVTEKAEIPASPAKVWAAIGDFCGIVDWHPAIAKCEQSKANGQTVRTLTTGDGGVLVETLETRDDAGMSYTYRIKESPLPVQHYIATIKVSGSGDRSTVEWTSTFDPKGVGEVEARKVISGIYTAGFDGLRKKF